MWHDPIAPFPFFSPFQSLAAVVVVVRSGSGRVLKKMIVQVRSLTAAIVEIGRAEGRGGIVVTIGAVVRTRSFADD